MSIPLSETSSLVLMLDGGLSYPSQKAKAVLEYLDSTKGQILYQKLKHLSPYIDETIRNRKFIIHNYIKKILSKEKGVGQVLVLGCGWDPILIKMSELFPKSLFFGVDESTNQQAKISRQLLPDSSIFYVSGDLNNGENIVKQLTQKGWDKKLKTCIVTEGITYYVPPKDFWKTLECIKNHTVSHPAICGDFLANWKETWLSKRGQTIAETIFNTIKEICSLKEYYPYTKEIIMDKLGSLGFSQVDFFLQDEIQKRRTKSVHPWKPEDSYIQLFTADSDDK